MNLKQKCLVGATVMVLATGHVWAAAADPGCLSSGGQANGCAAAPEIDATSGTSAIALLTGVLLLMRKGRKSDEVKSGE